MISHTNFHLHTFIESPLSECNVMEANVNCFLSKHQQVLSGLLRPRQRTHRFYSGLLYMIMILFSMQFEISEYLFMLYKFLSRNNWNFFDFFFQSFGISYFKFDCRSLKQNQRLYVKLYVQASDT